MTAAEMHFQTAESRHINSCPLGLSNSSKYSFFFATTNASTSGIVQFGPLLRRVLVGAGAATLLGLCGLGHLPRLDLLHAIACALSTYEPPSLYLVLKKA
jgi:hypothetical protein